MPGKFKKSINDYSAEKLNGLLSQKYKEMMNLNFRLAAGLLQQPHLLRETKKQIAVIKTLISAKRSEHA